ncbi:MAG: hypothetical protein AB7V50_11500 [Vampirovibrionia bacterium]
MLISDRNSNDDKDSVEVTGALGATGSNTIKSEIDKELESSIEESKSDIFGDSTDNEETEE